MPFTFNPFTGTFDVVGASGGGAVTSVSEGVGTFVSPTVGAVIVDLDIADLTTTTSIATGDFLALYLAAGTTPADQRKITFSDFLGAELLGLRTLATLGVVTRTGAGTYTTSTGTAPRMVYWGASNALSSKAGFEYNDASDFLLIPTAGRIGVGITSPLYPFDADGTTTQRLRLHTHSNSNGTLSRTQTVRSRVSGGGGDGTALLAPTPSTADIIGAFDFAGSDGAGGFTASAILFGVAAEAFSASAKGSHLQLWTCMVGDSVARGPRVEISSEGALRIYEAVAVGVTPVNYSGFANVAQTTDITYTLPLHSTIAAGRFLQTDAVGALTWATPAGAGTVTSVAGGVGITNTPEPIVGAGTVDLDIFGLTTETAVASGDWFAFVDVSVGTSPSSQRKVTFAEFENDLTLSNQIGPLSIAKGGTGQITAVAAFNALDPLTTLGDILYHNGTDSVRLAGQITTQKQFLSQTGTGAVSAAPAWAALVVGDLPAHNLLSATHGDTVAASPPVRGSLVKANATPLWAEFPRGATANMPLHVNAANTDIEYSVLVETGGGTGETTYTIGDILYSDAANSLAKRAGNTVTDNRFLRSTGSGGLATAPTWELLTATDLAVHVLATNVALGAQHSISGASAGQVLRASSATAANFQALAAADIGSGANLTSTNSDTNIKLNITAGGTAALLVATTVDAAWAGTLSASRLNSNVVHTVVSGTNVTGIIAAQNLTLGWTGTLDPTLGGTGLNALGAADAILAVNAAGTGLEYKSLSAVGGTIRGLIRNTAASGASHAVIHTQIDAGSTGDAYARYTFGTTEWSAGVDSTDNSYKIHNSTTLATTSLLELTTTGELLLGTGTSAAKLHVQQAINGVDLAILCRNNGTTGVEDARVIVDTQTTGGDPVFQCTFGGSAAWTFGADNDASDAFVLAQSSTLGTTNRLSIATAAPTDGNFLRALSGAYTKSTLTIPDTGSANTAAFIAGTPNVLTFGTLPVNAGGTALTAVGAANQLFGTDNGATVFEHKDAGYNNSTNTLFGSATATENLTLEGNTADQLGFVNFNHRAQVVAEATTAAGVFVMLNAIPNGLTLNAASNNAFAAMRLDNASTINLAGDAVASSLGLLFSFESTIQNSPSGTARSFGPLFVLNCAPRVRAQNATLTGSPSLYGYIFQPVYDRVTAGGGTAPDVIALRYNSVTNIGVGWTVTNSIMAQMLPPTVGGSIGTLGGVDIGALTGGTTITYALQSAITAAATRYFLRDTGGAQSSLVGKFTTYNNIATEGFGLPAITDEVALTGQTANIATTNFTNAGTAGLYRIRWYLVITTTAAVPTITVTIAYTDNSAARTVTSAAIAFVATNFGTGSHVVRLNSGNITYATTLTGAIGTGVYAFYATCERLV